MREVGEWNPSCVFPGSLGCPWTWSCAVWQSPVVNRNTVQRSPRQVVESLLTLSVQASGTPSSAGWPGFRKTLKMLPLLLVWKAFVTVLQRFACSDECFDDLVFFFFTWRKIYVKRLLEKPAHCYMMCCCILLIEIQQGIIWQILADRWEGDRTTTSPGYLTFSSSWNLFLKVYLICLWSRNETLRCFG